MGEKQNQPFQLSFKASLKVDFQGSRVTSDGGLILIRELDERLGLERLIEEQLSDSRQRLNKRFTLADLLLQSVYSRLAGYEEVREAEGLAAGPTFRFICSPIIDLGAAGVARVALRLRLQKTGAEGGGSEPCVRNRLRGSKRGSSDGQNRDVGTARSRWELDLGQVRCVRGRRSVRRTSQRSKSEIPNRVPFA